MIIHPLRSWTVIDIYDVYPLYESLYISGLSVLNRFVYLKMSQKIDTRVALIILVSL